MSHKEQRRRTSAKAMAPLSPILLYASFEGRGSRHAGTSAAAIAYLTVPLRMAPQNGPQAQTPRPVAAAPVQTCPSDDAATHASFPACFTPAAACSCIRRARASRARDQLAKAHLQLREAGVALDGLRELRGAHVSDVVVGEVKRRHGLVFLEALANERQARVACSM